MRSVTQRCGGKWKTEAKKWRRAAPGKGRNTTHAQLTRGTVDWRPLVKFSACFVDRKLVAPTPSTATLEKKKKKKR